MTDRTAPAYSQWLVKSAYEAWATPLTYGVVDFLKREEGMDAYDTETNFNPLSMQDEPKN
jgi:hypothetical protein